MCFVIASVGCNLQRAGAETVSTFLYVALGVEHSVVATLGGAGAGTGGACKAGELPGSTPVAPWLPLELSAARTIKGFGLQDLKRHRPPANHIKTKPSFGTRLCLEGCAQVIDGRCFTERCEHCKRVRLPLQKACDNQK